MIRILIVFGTRPEAIKMAPVIARLREKVADGTTVDFRVCSTGQHREMLDQVLGIFGITPDYELGVMRTGQGLAETAARVLEGVTGVLGDYQPDMILVQGDTTTAFVASLAAYYQRIPVGHIEAGLRTDNIYSPWPEEVNRRLTAVIARWHFAPTEGAKRNLLREGIPEDAIRVTGNTVIDSLQHVVALLNQEVELAASLSAKFSYLNPDKRLILVTAHRRENFGAPFENICAALRTLSERGDVDVLCPAHPNPHVQEAVDRQLRGRQSIHVVEPLDYLEFIYLMNRAYLLLTDSGGVQEEAPSLGKPVLVMREVTERPEAVAAGTVKLVGTDGRIIAESSRLLDDTAEYLRMSRAHNPYGDGQAADRIVRRLLDEPIPLAR